MNGFGTFVDIHGILEPTREATREQALRLRELWRMQLRLLEDMHGLPHSFQTKTDIEREAFYDRQNKQKP